MRKYGRGLITWTQIYSVRCSRGTDPRSKGHPRQCLRYCAPTILNTLPSATNM